MAKCTGMRCPMQFGYKVDECDYKDCPWRTEPMTNADRVRSMNDEELAEVLSAPCFGCVVKNCRLHNYGSDGCMAAFLKWLKQPAETE